MCCFLVCLIQLLLSSTTSLRAIGGAGDVLGMSGMSPQSSSKERRAQLMIFCAVLMTLWSTVFSWQTTLWFSTSVHSQQSICIRTPAAPWLGWVFFFSILRKWSCCCAFLICAAVLVFQIRSSFRCRPRNLKSETLSTQFLLKYMGWGSGPFLLSYFLGFCLVEDQVVIAASWWQFLHWARPSSRCPQTLQWTCLGGSVMHVYRVYSRGLAHPCGEPVLSLNGGERWAVADQDLNPEAGGV